jgi:AraC-like DNA-binding protein
MKRQQPRLTAAPDSIADNQAAGVRPFPHAAAPERIRADALSCYRPMVAALGGDDLTLLRGADIDPSHLDDANAVVSCRAVADLLERTATALACPDFGMRLAAAQARDGGGRFLGPLDVALRNAASLGDALRYLADRIAAYCSGARLFFEILSPDGEAFLAFDMATERLPQERQVVEYFAALLQQLLAAVTAGQARAGEVWFAHDALAAKPAYRAGLSADVRFGRSMNALFFDAAALDRPIPGADPQLFEIAASYIDHRFPAAPATLAGRVRILIARLLVDGDCSNERVAAALGLHPRTLQRRLKDEGQSFETIRDGVRRDVALRYLRRPEVSLVKVTEILGYSETSVLSRSCHRWFSASPRKLRSALNR